MGMKRQLFCVRPEGEMCEGHYRVSNTLFFSLLAIHSSLYILHAPTTPNPSKVTFSFIPINLIQVTSLNNCMKFRLSDCPHQVFLMSRRICMCPTKMSPLLFSSQPAIFPTLLLPSHVMPCPGCHDSSLTPATHIWRQESSVLLHSIAK